MRALVQRVSSASVCVDEKVIGEIGRGLCCFVGVTHSDDATAARRLAERVWTLRIFEDGEGRINRSAADVGFELLVISQFTLYADTARGRRPSFVRAAPPEQAQPLVAEVVGALGRLGARVAAGQFGAMMAVKLVNDGPFTVMVEC